MITGVESNSFSVRKAHDYKETAFEIEVCEISNYIVVYKSELDELIHLLQKAKELIE